MSILSAIILLFFVMDPVGNVPLFLVVLKNVDQHRRKKIIIRESLIALGVLVFFLLVGRYFLDIVQISEPALSIAGGIVLFLIAVRMIFAAPEGTTVQEPVGEPLVVPLAMPLIAGPSAIATVLLLQSREPSRVLDWLLALVCAWFLSTLILLFASNLKQFLGDKVLVALERLMGMLLTTIAVQMFLTGISQFSAQ